MFYIFILDQLVKKRRKMMREKIGRSRKKQIKFFLNDEEFKIFKSKVEKSNSTQSEFLRSLISDKEIVVIDFGVEIFKELGRIGSNLNQLAKIANTNGSIEEIEMLKKQIKGLSELTKEIKSKL
jgi:hypothetical protein